MSTLPPVNNQLPVVPPAVSVAPAVVLTQEQKIDAAVKTLSRTALDNLWEENVTNASLLMKVYGLFCYAWNRSKAVEDDAKHGATIEQFNKAANEFVKAVVQRPLTKDERDKNGIDPVQYISDQSALNAHDMQVNAENKLNAFYDVFKKRVTVEEKHDDNSAEFVIFAAAAEKIIKDLSSNVEKLSSEIRVITPNTIPTKIKTATQEFNKRIFDDMINGYASQTMDKITIASFQDKGGKIGTFFKDLLSNDPAAKTVLIETHMREAIRKNHDAAAFTKASADAMSLPRINAARTAIEGKLNADKTTLETELTALRGTTGFNGTVDKARTEKRNAKALMTTAYNALTAYAHQAGAFDPANRTATIAYLTAFVATPVAGQTASRSTVNVAKLQELLQVFTQKNAEFETKKQAHHDLRDKLNTIATYHGSDIYDGGRLYDIDVAMQPAVLDASAAAETTKHGAFYTELSQVVTDANKELRSQDLHDIINRVTH